MRKLNKYNSFLESKREFDIYDLYEKLKEYTWGNGTADLRNIQKWSDRFIGDSVFEKVSELVDRIFDSLRGFDFGDFKNGLYEIFDEYLEKHNHVMLCVLHSDPMDNFTKSKKFSGSIGVSTEDSEKTRVICTILRDMISPTIRIGYPSILLRNTKEEETVSDKKYQCINFNIDNYEISKNLNVEIPNGNAVGRRAHTTITEFDLNKIRKYDLDDYYDSYKPGIYIGIGGHGDKGYGKYMNLRKLESDFDSILPRILQDVDYDEIIWDAARGSRRFDDNTDIDDYTVKILLKI